MIDFCRFTITNERLPDRPLLVAGNCDAGIIRWIEKYGFYEGGEQNAYRLDPTRIVEVLTGQEPQTQLS